MIFVDYLFYEVIINNDSFNNIKALIICFMKRLFISFYVSEFISTRGIDY